MTNLRKNSRPHLKNNQSKKGWGMAQMVECPPNQHKALSSIQVLLEKKESEKTGGRKEKVKRKPHSAEGLENKCNNRTFLTTLFICR
jgi:hypothetical protein